jgi:hypothetical protein
MKATVTIGVMPHPGSNSTVPPSRAVQPSLRRAIGRL